MKVRKFIRVFFFILLVAIMVASSIYILSNLLQEKEQQEDFEEIQEIVEDNTQEESIPENNIDLYNLYLINNDVVGWIKIEGTNINYPVMQNGEYYLRRNIHKIIYYLQVLPHRYLIYLHYLLLYM